MLQENAVIINTFSARKLYCQQPCMLFWTSNHASVGKRHLHLRRVLLGAPGSTPIMLQLVSAHCCPLFLLQQVPLMTMS